MVHLKSSSNNKEARLLFIDYWANFVRTHSDKEWGKQHTKFINSMMQNAKNYPLTPKEYLHLKNEILKHKQ
jgi:hypothetical protein